MYIDPKEVKRRFDGTHHKGSLTFAGSGASAKHQLINLFLEATNTPKVTRVQYQLDVQQARSLVEMLTESIDDLSPDPNVRVN